MTDSKKTLDEILNLAAAQFKVPREKLTPDDDFFKTLGIDSLQALDLLTRLEHHFNVELPDYELQGVSDFRTLASRAWIRQLLRDSCVTAKEQGAKINCQSMVPRSQFVGICGEIKH